MQDNQRIMMKNYLFFSMFLAPFMAILLILNTINSNGIGFLSNQQYTGVLGILLLSIAFKMSMNSSFKYKTQQVTHLYTKADLVLWAGSILLFLHSGQVKHTLIPWLGIFMLLTFLSHLTIGKYLFIKTYNFNPKTNSLTASKAEVSIEVSANSDSSYRYAYLLEKWKLIHFIIFYIFTIVILFHLFSLFLLWV